MKVTNSYIIMSLSRNLINSGTIFEDSVGIAGVLEGRQSGWGLDRYRTLCEEEKGGNCCDDE